MWCRRTLVSHQIFSGMRNFAYQAVRPELGQCTAHFSTEFLIARSFGIQSRADFPVRKTTDEVFAICYCFKQLHGLF